jgi:hypothetical protein
MSIAHLLWYLLAAVAFGVFPLAMVATLHRQRMKELEIIRSYAEKGGEPPEAVTRLLDKQNNDVTPRKWKSTVRGSMLNSALIHVYIACMIGGVAWWRIEAGPPRWALYVSVTAAVFYGLCALALIIGALTTRKE